MNPLLRLRHRWSTRLAILVAILLFSATAVEVAPHAIDVLQDLGWLPPDAAEAPAEAAALPQPEDTRLSGSGTLAEVDGVALDRLTQFTETLPGSLQDVDAYTGESDETDAVELLEGVVSLDPALNAAGSAAGGSRMALADFTAMTTAAAGTPPDTSVLVGAPGTNGELASTTTDTTVADKTAGVERTAGSASTSAAPPAESTTEEKPGSTAGYALAEAPRGESGTGAVSTVAEISPVAVPEPATLFLLGGGLLALARFSRRKAQ